MLKASKKNRVVRIPDDKRPEYEALGYTITTMSGETLFEPEDKDKTIQRLTAEIEALKAENEALKAANAPADTITAGHLDEGQLSAMTVADLKKLAQDMGIDVDGLKKADLIAAILAVDVTTGVDADVAEDAQAAV